MPGEGNVTSQKELLETATNDISGSSRQALFSLGFVTVYANHERSIRANSRTYFFLALQCSSDLM